MVFPDAWIRSSPQKSHGDNNLLTADLHSHTVYSDGSDTPEEVLEKAGTLRLNFWALTDHDTLHWLSRPGRALYETSRKRGVCFVRGVELSTRDESSGKKAHILGYWPGNEEVSAPRVKALCRTMSQRRTQATLTQISILRSKGYDISEAEVRAVSAGDQLFKQDILKAMVEKNLFAEDFRDFYRLHFKKGGDCYQRIQYIPCVSAVEAIVRDGGFAVLAHPGQQDNLHILPDLKDAGLWGIEMRHPTHNAEYREKVGKAAKEYSLYMTGGSDYHGIFHPDRELGHYLMRGEEVEALRDAGLFL